MSQEISHYHMEMLKENGYAVLEPYEGEIDPKEWEDLEYVNWKSSGDTRFAPLASAYGDIECNGFWHFDPPKTDKDGVWIDSQTEIAPTLTWRAQEPGANVGRCRIIELQPNSYADAIYNQHLDDNNRLNPEGEGWVVRAFMQLTDNPDSYMILRHDIDDPSTEVRIPLPKGTQLLVDSQRMWHSVWHEGDEPRYSLITSYESGPELEKWLESKNAVGGSENAPIDPQFARESEEEAQKRRTARTEFYGYDPTTIMSEA
ncbi:MAG: hypothetical protein WAS05_03725 [Candidatus Nanopelagicales bacterium]